MADSDLMLRAARALLHEVPGPEVVAAPGGVSTPQSLKPEPVVAESGWPG